MSIRNQNILIIVFMLSGILAAIYGLNEYSKRIMEGKPHKDYTYYPSETIQASKENGLFEYQYLSERPIFHSKKHIDSIQFGEIWIERNDDQSNVYRQKFILICNFVRATQDDLHEFRLIPTYMQKHPKSSRRGQIRIRFNTNEIKDTFQLEVIEKITDEEVFWPKEEITDTISLIRIDSKTR